MKTPRNTCSSRRLSKTPSQLGLIAARLFGHTPLSQVKESNQPHAHPSPAVSLAYDQLYLDQCHNWFTRETRFGKTPKPEPVNTSSLIAAKPKSLRKKKPKTEKRLRNKRMTKCLLPQAMPVHVPQPFSQTVTVAATTSPKSIDNIDEEVMPGCVACSQNPKDDLNSSTFFKRLANNVLICSLHRSITHWMLDYFDHQMLMRGKLPQHEVHKFETKWKSEDDEVQADREVPFSVIEDRRLVQGVDRYGDDAWESILSDFYFVPNRLPSDLKERWQQLNEK